MRLTPLFPFNLVNFAFGLTRIRLVEYVIASFVCMAPGAIAYTYLGYAGRTAASGDAGAIRAAIIALALLAAVAFIPRLIRAGAGRARSGIRAARADFAPRARRLILIRCLNYVRKRSNGRVWNIRRPLSLTWRRGRHNKEVSMLDADVAQR